MEGIKQTEPTPKKKTFKEARQHFETVFHYRFHDPGILQDALDLEQIPAHFNSALPTESANKRLSIIGQDVVALWAICYRDSRQWVEDNAATSTYVWHCTAGWGKQSGLAEWIPPKGEPTEDELITVYPSGSWGYIPRHGIRFADVGPGGTFQCNPAELICRMNSADAAHTDIVLCLF